MSWLRGICRFEFSAGNGEVNFEIGWLWIAIMAFGLWHLFS